MTAATLSSTRLQLSDLTRLSTIGLRTRKLRAGLSALGIAIGVAAIVAVLGLSSSSQAGLLNEINQLGTNLLTVSSGQTLFGTPAELPTTAPAMIGRIAGVQQVQSIGELSGANAYRNPYIPSVDTNALTIQAASLDLLPVVATTVAQGNYLDAATEPPWVCWRLGLLDSNHWRVGLLGSVERCLELCWGDVPAVAV